MKKIICIYTKTKRIDIDQQWSNYLNSYIYLFTLHKQFFPNDNNEILVKQSEIEDLKVFISKSMSDLLSYYVPPNEKELQKHPSRFEKIIFEDKVYKVNYRMSISGRLIFLINQILIFIDSSKNENLDIILRLE